jgi:hypothetical protein
MRLKVSGLKKLPARFLRGLCQYLKKKPGLKQPRSACSPGLYAVQFASQIASEF